MEGLQAVGKLVVFGALFIFLFGVLLMFWDRIPFIGRLSGDIIMERNNLKFYFPLVSPLIISLMLTVVINLVLRLWTR